MRRFFFFQNILQNREALVTKRHLVVWWCILLLFSNRSLFLSMSRIAIAECQRSDWKILQFLPFYQELPLHIWKKKKSPCPRRSHVPPKASHLTHIAVCSSSRLDFRNIAFPHQRVYTLASKKTAVDFFFF